MSRRVRGGRKTKDEIFSPLVPPPPAHSTFHFSVHSDRNFPNRRTMEDSHAFSYDYAGQENQGLFAVFDGHGGKTAALWAAEHFPMVFERLLAGEQPVEETLHTAFAEIDSQLTPANGIHSGCTAVVALLTPPAAQAAGVLYTANVGDARAVLYRSGKAVRLSYDHKGSDLLEQQRVRAAGGFISNERVSGLLAVTRSLGDHELKEYVIGAPYTTATALTASDTLLVVACDGVWDILDDQTVCEMADEHVDPLEAARVITDRAIADGSGDNITCMVVYLQRRDAQAGAAGE